ncbi:MAG TPA: hypothetical protein VFC33_00530 [Acidimicrobiia bacterium]|nr:hypothetical protein [Acidimicrobiia bacterium]
MNHVGTVDVERAAATWREHGWVLCEGLVDRDTIDAAVADLALVFPTPEQYHADPDGERRRRLGTPPPSDEAYVWPPDGPGFRPLQHAWKRDFPFPGSGALNRLLVHPAIVELMTSALGADDVVVYQAQLTAKYTGFTNYEQPLHTDRNHSWLPARHGPPWDHVEGFLYLSDVTDGTAPTRLVSVRDSVRHDPGEPLVLPAWDPELYASERPAAGPRGSLLAYRNDVFHRAVDLTEPGGARFLLNVSYKVADRDWIGYHAWQSHANSSEWVAFVEGSTARELALLGFPPPGHRVWDAALLDATARRYPNLDLRPWREALR